VRLTGYTHQGTRFIGAVEDGVIRTLGTARDFYADPAAALARTPGEAVPFGDVERAPALPETARIFCVGINYRSHAVESKELAGLDQPKVPMVFGRFAQSLTVDDTTVPIPPNEAGLDWEVELAAVIGTEAWDVTEDSAMDHVLGYAAFNDLSARRKQLETPQFTLGKNADLSGPISDVVTKDEVGDPRDGLRVTTRVNGELMQDANTKDLIHTLGQIIAYITDTVTLLPGDVIATGTPGGVGAGRKPPIFLTDGDTVVVEVERVGRVTTHVADRRG